MQPFSLLPAVNIKHLPCDKMSSRSFLNFRQTKEHDKITQCITIADSKEVLYIQIGHLTINGIHFPIMSDVHNCQNNLLCDYK